MKEIYDVLVALNNWFYSLPRHDIVYFCISTVGASVTTDTTDSRECHQGNTGTEIFHMSLR